MLFVNRTDYSTKDQGRIFCAIEDKDFFPLRSNNCALK